MIQGNKKKVGLTLCKLAPMHIGHLFLLDTALQIVDELILVLYDCPNLIEIPLNIRAQWVRSLYPQIDVIEGWDAPNQHEDTPEVKRMQEEYIHQVLRGRKISHFISSEYYGDHMSKSLNAMNCLIDIDREKYHISSTMIRNSIHLYKNFIPAIVYKDLLVKVVIIGSPSDQSDTIAKRIAKKLNTINVPDLTFHSLLRRQKNNASEDIDFVTIATQKEKQYFDDQVIYSANNAIIYTSSSLIDHILNIAINRKFNQLLFNKAVSDIANYDLVFVNPDEDNIVSKKYGIDNKFLISQLQGNLNSLKVKFVTLDGNIEKKTDVIQKAINSFIKLKKFS